MTTPRTSALEAGRVPQWAAGLVVGFLLGLAPALVTTVLLLRHHYADPVVDWGVFLVSSVAVPACLSVVLEERWPHFARGTGMAVVVIACPLNLLILMGLLGASWVG